MEEARTDLVGREAELLALERFLDSLPEDPSALLIEGEAGIGKTALWLAALTAAGGRGHRVLQARPAEREATLSFAALADLVGETFDETRAALPAPQERSLAAALLRAETDEPADPRTTATALANVLTALAAETPVVVAIDDVQWLDPASARALEFAVRRLPAGVGLLLTRRSDGLDPPPLELDRALPEDRLERLSVGPLSLGALHHLIRDRLGTDAPARPTLVRIESASGGNPFFALEIARSLATGQAERSPGEPLPIPGTLQELVATRLEALSEAAQEAALVAAALSRPTTSTLLNALAVLPDAGAALTEAEEGAVLVTDRERIRFAHPLLEEAVYGSASSERRRQLHRHLAGIVTDREERARHLAKALRDPDEEAAADIEDAARAAMLRGAPDAAAELFEAARRLTPAEQPEDHARRMLGEASAVLDTGDFAGARRLAEGAVDASHTAAVKTKGLHLLGDIAWYEGEDRIGYLERSLLEAGDDEALRAETLAQLALANVSVDPRRALQDVDPAIELLGGGRNEAMLGRLMITKFFLDAWLGNGARYEVFDRALRLEAESGFAELSPYPLIWFAASDQFDAARSRHRLMERSYDEHGDDLSLGLWEPCLALTELRAGNWPLAEEHAERSAVLAEQFGPGGPWGFAFCARAVVDAHRGRIQRAHDTLGPMVDEMERREKLFWDHLILSALGFVEFAAGADEAAEKAWTRLAAELERFGIKDFLEDRSQPDHIEALLNLGKVEEARTILEHLEWRGQTLPRLWIAATLPRARALVLAAEDDLPGALAALGELDPKLASRLPFELGRTLLVEGQLRRRVKERRAAADALECALAIFERLGAPLWAERARSELRRVPIRRGAPDELTETEERVAELAAAGKTNKEVARALFISPKTVEANLSRVYRKLGIRSRAELGASMAERNDREGAAKP